MFSNPFYRNGEREKVSIVKAIVDGPNLVLPIYPIGQKGITLFPNPGFPRPPTKMTNVRVIAISLLTRARIYKIAFNKNK